MTRAARLVVPAACLAALLPWGNSAPGQGTFDQAVNAAIDRGVACLRRTQSPDGTWPRGGGGGKKEEEKRARETAGATALAGLTLLECGVPAKDDAVQKAAKAVRKYASMGKYVYAVSLCILFLDRLGDPQDEPFIEVLATRLLAAQDRTRWAWSYDCPDPADAEVARLTAALKSYKGPQERPAGQRLRTEKDLPKEVMDQIVQIYRTPARPALKDVDNSNTQFALLALWVARRHGIPADYAIAMVENRLRATQRPHGGWTYRYPSPLPKDPKVAAGMFKSPNYQPSAAMTCAGLLGMALAHAILDPGKQSKYNLANDPSVKQGFLALGTFVGKPTGDVSKATKLTNPGTAYYFLWSLERMAVVYDLKTIGDKDWYRWGAEILLANQGGDGGWHGAYAQGGCDTCFALLFLKRANVAHDLTVRLKGKGKDPGMAPPKLLEMIDKEFAPGIDKDRRGTGRQGFLAPSRRLETLQARSASDGPRAAARRSRSGLVMGSAPVATLTGRRSAG
jgi:hypothetical protein